MLLRLRESRRSRSGEDLRAAGWAPEHSVGQAAHLGMAALAGVCPKDIRQSGYLLKGPHYPSTQGPATGVAAGRIATGGVQFACFAEGTDEGVRRRGQRLFFHFTSFPSDLRCSLGPSCRQRIGQPLAQR